MNTADWDGNMLLLHLRQQVIPYGFEEIGVACPVARPDEGCNGKNLPEYVGLIPQLNLIDQRVNLLVRTAVSVQ